MLLLLGKDALIGVLIDTLLHLAAGGGSYWHGAERRKLSSFRTKRLC